MRCYILEINDVSHELHALVQVHFRLHNLLFHVLQEIELLHLHSIVVSHNN
jgi:hypothetical protein